MLTPELEVKLRQELEDKEGFSSYKEIQTWLKVVHDVEMSYTGVHQLVHYRLNERVHLCGECGYTTSRDHASGRVILNRGLENLVPVDGGKWKLSDNGVLSGISCLDKCRSRNANSQELEA